MVLFKINGERNSGTNFLSSILSKNGFPIYIQKITNNICYHWKHGIPRADIKLLNEQVIDIFIFKNIEEWLQSMYYNCYHLKKKNDFKDFLITKQQSVEKCHIDYETKKYINDDDNNKTIFEIRYYKFQKIMEYKQNNKFVLLVNLSYLQDENNLLYFLNFLNVTYMNNSIKGNYITKIPHTKNKSIQTPNRIYNIDIKVYKDIIDKYKNEEIENFINNLTFDTSNF